MNGTLTLIGKQKPLRGAQINKPSSLREVNNKILKAVSELKKASETAQCQHPTPQFLQRPHYFLSSLSRPALLFSSSSSLPYTATTSSHHHQPKQT